jgi:ADP-heptose:LPS heptosyltransferase
MTTAADKLAPPRRPEACDPRIIIPVVAGIGNALMAVPMVRQIRRKLPGAHVTIMARTPAMGQVFERFEEVDQVLLMGRGALGMGRSMGSAGRQVRPHIILIPFPSNRWEYMALALASGARRRIMHGYPVGRLSALGIIPAQRLPAERGIHDVQQNLRLLQLLDIEPDLDEAPSFPVVDADREAAAGMLEGIGMAGDVRPIVIHAGSARTILAQAKRWPPGNYARLAAGLIERFGARIILLEGPDEPGVAAEITGHIPGSAVRILRLAGPLGHAAAVLERSALYIGTDSGLAHLSAAVGTPPITLFGPADPGRVCPFGYRRLVLQPGCSCCPCLLYPFEATRPKLRQRDPACISRISVEQILAMAGQAGAV